MGHLEKNNLNPLVVGKKEESLAFTPLDRGKKLLPAGQVFCMAYDATSQGTTVMRSSRISSNRLPLVTVDICSPHRLFPYDEGGVPSRLHFTASGLRGFERERLG